MTTNNIITIGDDEIQVTPHDQHEFTLTSALVAQGYGVSSSTIRDHKSVHADELVEGKHWIAVENTGVGNSDAGQRHGNPTITLWTKRGIIRLGFFIRSPRAIAFRDMAEDLVLGAVERGFDCDRFASLNNLVDRTLELQREIIGRMASHGDRITLLEHGQKQPKHVFYKPAPAPKPVPEPRERGTWGGDRRAVSGKGVKTLAFIMKVLPVNPRLTVSEVANITGVSRASACRYLQAAREALAAA